METVLAAGSDPAEVMNMEDRLDRLGGISPTRVRTRPSPGRATEQDVIHADVHENRLCELVDGSLVEKAMGWRESVLAGVLIEALRRFVVPRNLGFVSGEAGMMRLFPGLVRIPEVAFVSWGRFPGGRLPQNAIPDLVPDLVAEVLSEGNTPREMDRKLREYLQAGVRLIWMVDPHARIVTAYTSLQKFDVLDVTRELDGGEVLPGFRLALGELFAELDRQSGPERRG